MKYVYQAELRSPKRATRITMYRIAEDITAALGIITKDFGKFWHIESVTEVDAMSTEDEVRAVQRMIWRGEYPTAPEVPPDDYEHLGARK